MFSLSLSLSLIYLLSFRPGYFRHFRDHRRLRAGHHVQRNLAGPEAQLQAPKRLRHQHHAEERLPRFARPAPNTQIERERERKMHTHTCTQADKQTYRHTDIQTGMHTHTYVCIHTTDTHILCAQLDSLSLSPFDYVLSPSPLKFSGCVIIFQTKFGRPTRVLLTRRTPLFIVRRRRTRL